MTCICLPNMLRVEMCRRHLTSSVLTNDRQLEAQKLRITKESEGRVIEPIDCPADLTRMD
jgi:hypothetical protein